MSWVCRTAPTSGLVASRSEVLGALEQLIVGKEGVHGNAVPAALLVDGEGFLVEMVRVAKRALRNLRTVMAVKTVDVVHDTRLVGLECRQDEEVLQVSQLYELVGKLCLDDGLDGGRHLAP